MTKLLYKPVGLAVGIAGGALASVIFTQLWKRMAGEKDAPRATDETRSWTEVLAAAALHGLVFEVVKAAVDRGGAVGVRRLTGAWPA
ncbi:MAG: DUF4235 domain-containing protein [Micromonosporaceae bacterium]